MPSCHFRRMLSFKTPTFCPSLFRYTARPKFLRTRGVMKHSETAIRFLKQIAHRLNHVGRVHRYGSPPSPEGCPAQSCQGDRRQLRRFSQNIRVGGRALSETAPGLSGLMAAGIQGTCLTHQQKASRGRGGGLIVLVCIRLLPHLLAGWF